MTGVSVIGMKDKISGLLFANDAVILAKSADELQKSFDILTEWCKRWDMNVNNKKCGIMAINCSTDATFKIQNQLIPQKKNDKSQISKWIADTEAGTSCNWMRTYWIARRYAKSGFIEKRFIEECPFCRNIAPETIEHMLLECSRWAQVTTKPPLFPASISMR
ncbi:hypothetical protein BB561_001125 [Smittium simulii]|uniref:Reverse transcriptase domain-containing protein n=1 Tax=Smittium simulii TaxID=133385 RepID=A0A2T9YVZ1_9FUNG|nr:hypothetical protein BB561_001125 [Smittium simulii]